MDVLLTGGRRSAAGWPNLAAAGSAVLLAVAVVRYDASGVALGLAAVAGLLLFLRKPHAATLVFVFLLYSNIPGVAHQLHGVPKLVAGAFPLILAVPLLHGLVIRRQRLRGGPILGLMIAWIVVMLVSSLGAVDPDISLSRVGTFLIEGLLIYFLLVNVVRDRAMLRRVVWGVLMAGSLLGGLSLYQSVTGSYTQQFGGLAERQLRFEHKRDVVDERAQPDKLYKADRADGPMLGTNRYAQAMIVLLPLALMSYRLGRSRRERILAIAAGALILSGMLLSYSRGALVTLVLLVIAAAWVGFIQRRHAMILFLIGALLTPLAAPVLFTRFASLASVGDLMADGESAEADGAIRGRATEMLASLLVFRDHPVIGVGPGQYTPHYSVRYQQNPNIQFRDIPFQRRAHTLYFELAAETGIVGLLVFLSMPLLLLRRLWGRARFAAVQGRDEDLQIAMAFILSIFGYLGTAMFLHLAYERYYWFLLGLAAAALMALRATRGPAGDAREDDEGYVAPALRS